MPSWLQHILGLFGGSSKSTSYKDALGNWVEGDPNAKMVAPQFSNPQFDQTMQAQAEKERLVGVAQQQLAQQPTPMPIPSITPDPNTQLPGGQDWQNTLNLALQIAQQYGIPPAVIAGQMALESNRGQSSMAKQKHNYFGYQAYDANPNASAAFQDPSQSIVAYAKTLSEDPRYNKAYGDRSDPNKMLQDIKDAGYASDPNYVAKVMSTPEYRKYLKK